MKKLTADIVAYRKAYNADPVNKARKAAQARASRQAMTPAQRKAENKIRLERRHQREAWLKANDPEAFELQRAKNRERCLQNYYKRKEAALHEG